ncbi:MAG: RNA methyltransferase [Candidatus Marinimicrobia bacterium]|nr:RNA methyltransferase [Candidatus Neomarinimicrobiota bacterium]
MGPSSTDLKYLRSLSVKKYRRLHGRFLVEGSRLVEEALQAADRVEELLCTEKYKRSKHFEKLNSLAVKGAIPVRDIRQVQAGQISATRHTQGVFAVCRLPAAGIGEQASKPPVLVLDSIADPGNLGTLLRTADWFGVPTVLVVDTSADIYSPKVVRGAMGAHFHFKELQQLPVDLIIGKLRQADIPIIGAMLDGEPIGKLPSVGNKWALVVGNEAQGIGPAMEPVLDIRVTIQGRGQAESLNVAVAAGILLQALCPD